MEFLAAMVRNWVIIRQRLSSRLHPCIRHRCREVRNQKAINLVYPHVRLGTGLYDVFIIRCRGLDVQLDITDGRLTPCKRDELSAAAGYALIAALKT